MSMIMSGKKREKVKQIMKTPIINKNKKIKIMISKEIKNFINNKAVIKKIISKMNTYKIWTHLKKINLKNMQKFNQRMIKSVDNQSLQNNPNLVELIKKK